MQAPGLRILWLGALALGVGPIAYGQGLRSIQEATNLAANTVYETTPSMQYFGGRQSLGTPATRVRRLLPAPQPVQIGGVKPFENLQRRPTLSPYLGLDLRESELGIPNYHAFVRPQQQQRLANQSQAAKIRQLNQKLRTATAQGIVSNSPSGGVPTTGHSAQFLNTGGYFIGPR